MRILLTTLAAALLATGASADLMKPVAPVVVRGAITAVDGSTLSVKANDGSALTLVLARASRSPR